MPTLTRESLNRDAFQSRPWTDLAIPEALEQVRAYTFVEERQAAVWLARECYSGQGAIVDAGTFLGGSALSLAVGLADNERLEAREKTGRIQCFDIFTWARWIREEWLPPGARLGTSFVGVFHDTVRAYQHLITIHPGDITKRVWNGEPVELLFVDCAKNFAANAAVIEMFFPRLIPERSIVNQQDYAIQSRLIWLHATMEFFADRFEELGSTEIGGTTLFRLRRPISCDDTQACIDALSRDCVGLAERAAARFAQDDRRRSAIEESVRLFVDKPFALAR